MMDKVLLVDDEIELATMLKDYLQKEGFEIIIANSFQEGQLIFEKSNFDVIILDINLGDGSGLELCKIMRKKTGIPIVILSAKSGDVDKIMGLGLGSDDYITKPFSPAELSARIQAHIRRYKELTKPINNSHIKHFGDLHIDDKAFELYINEKKINLTAKEFQILNYLANNPGQVFTKEQLFNHIWGYDDFGDVNTVTVHIRKIREKIEDDPKNPIYIKTIWGIGYKLEK
ncbi:response regulator transcription factor [Mycoplasmatota bacterium]|nr:response regulator transcription factor [Mycoplasmatota bacterium]